MMPLTTTTPKPLLKVNGKCLIDYVLDSIPEEIDEVVIAVDYLGDKIKKHVGKKHNGKKIQYVQGSSKGNAYSFLEVKKYFNNERFLLIYADEIPNPEDVKNCLKEELSLLFFISNGKWIKDGVMVLNTDIFKYQPIDENFSSMIDVFISNHKMTRVDSDRFIGEINTPQDLIKAERMLNEQS